MFNVLAEWDIDRTNIFINWFYSSELFFGIAKYSVCILTGIILAYLICTKEGERLGISKDDVLVCATITVPLCILGARIWYLASESGNSSFYDSYGFFKATWYTLLYIVGYDAEYGYYQGIAGLAIHGGVAVAIIMTIICSKWKHFYLPSIADEVAPGLLIGQICGRWGNFFNQEAHGGVIGGWTLNGDYLVPNLSLDEQWNTITKVYHIPKFVAKYMYIEGNEDYYYGIVDGVQKYGYITGYNFYHPTFLYESLLNMVGLIIYFILRRQKWVRSGFFAGFYLIWYGIVRFFIEIVRTDSLYLHGTSIKMAQLTSILMIVAGVGILVYIYLIKKTDKYLDIIERVKEEKKNQDDSVEKEEIVVVK